jgi:hypothetical protein
MSEIKTPGIKDLQQLLDEIIQGAADKIPRAEKLVATLEESIKLKRLEMMNITQKEPKVKSDEVSEELKSVVELEVPEELKTYEGVVDDPIMNKLHSLQVEWSKLLDNSYLIENILLKLEQYKTYVHSNIHDTKYIIISHIILDVCKLDSIELVKSTIEFCNTELSNINATGPKDGSSKVSLNNTQTVTSKNSLNPGEAVPVISEAGTSEAASEAVPVISESGTGEAASEAVPVISEAGTGEASSKVVPVISESGTGEAVTVNSRVSLSNKASTSGANSGRSQQLHIGGSSLLVEPEIIQTITPNIKSNPNVVTSMKQLFNPTLVDMAFVNSNEYDKYIRCIPKLYEIGRESLNILIKKYMIIYYEIRLLIEDMLNTTDDVTSEYFTYYLTDLNKLRKKQHATLQDIEYNILTNTKKDENKQNLKYIRLLIQEIYKISNYEYYLYKKSGTWTDLPCEITEGNKLLSMNLTSYTSQHDVQDYFDYLINEYIYYKQSQCIYFVNPDAFTDLLYDRLEDECNNLYKTGITEYYRTYIDPSTASNGNSIVAVSRPVNNVQYAIEKNGTLSSTGPAFSINDLPVNPPISKAADSTPVIVAVNTHPNQATAIPADSTPVIVAKNVAVTTHPNQATAIPADSTSEIVAVTTHPNQATAIPADSTPVIVAVNTHPNQATAIPADSTPASVPIAFAIEPTASTPVFAENDSSVTKHPNTKFDDSRANSVPLTTPAVSKLHSLNDMTIATTLEKSKYADPTPESQEWYNALLKADNIQKTENIDLINIIGILNNIIIHLNTKKEIPDSQVSLLLDYLEIITDSKMMKAWNDMIFGLVFKPETNTPDLNSSINEIIQSLRTDVKIDATMKQHIEKYIIEKLNVPNSKYNNVIQKFKNIPIDSDLSNIKDEIILVVA